MVFTAAGAPIVAALSKTDDTIKAKIKAEVYDKVNQKFAGVSVDIGSGSLVISGEK